MGPTREEAQVTERELTRNTARRLAIIRQVQEISGNVALTCRYYGITRHCYYVWLRRYVESWASPAYATDPLGPT